MQLWQQTIAQIGKSRSGKSLPCWKGEVDTNPHRQVPWRESRALLFGGGLGLQQSQHRRSFINKVRTEEPDSIMLSPVCKLWSMMQELNIAPTEKSLSKSVKLIMQPCSPLWRSSTRSNAELGVKQLLSILGRLNRGAQRHSSP